MANRLFLIDGHALIFKMYYAFLRRPMINSKGADMSVLFGFTKYILELIEREHPTHLAVSFDPPGGTFRNDMYPQYKANRPPTPQLVIDALEPLTDLCKAMNIPVLMVKGYEADDVIGTVALAAARQDYQVFMVTPDKDYGQLIRENVWQYKPGRSGGDDEIVGVREICDRYSILDPVQVIDMLTICGDAADNVPGVKGIGEVWAGKLVSQYGSVENIYVNLDRLTQKQRDMFVASRPYIDLSKKLVTIKTDVPLEVDFDDMKVDMDFSPEIADLFEKYEFRSLKKFISHISSSRPALEYKTNRIDVEEATAVQVSTAVCASGRCSVIVEADGPGIYTPISRITVAAVTKSGCIAAEGSAAMFKAILEDPTITKFGYDLKYQMNLLSNEGISIVGKLRDVELMHYLLDPEKAHKLDILSKHYLGVDLYESAPAAQLGSLFDELDQADDMPVQRNKYKEAAAVILIGMQVWNQMQEAGISNLYETMEEPLIRVLSRMERNGVKVDMASLMEYAASLRAEIADNESVVRQIAGDPFLNVSSPKQVGELIFEKLKLNPKAKKSPKGSWSTDEDTLLELADENPVIDAILDYRAAKKLLSTYIEPFPKFISPTTGRIHTTFNQALTSTGRLSSSNPNLQNIPIRTEKGRSIRKAFVPQDPESFILSADYSQIELRIMAHLSNDEHLINAFRAGIDVHSATAAKIFGIPLADVNADQRRIAKTANFGIMYGISAFGLAQRLRIPRSDAKKIIDEYFQSFPAISAFIGQTLDSARECGYVETLFGRRRYIPDINSRNATIRQLAERNAVNAPIQGTSADIIKMAMIGVDRRIRDLGLASRMVLQIHDELVFEAPASEVEVLRRVVVQEMENVIKLSIPLTVECKYGKNWLEAH